MDAALPPEELLSRARNALFARRHHLLSLLRHLLRSLRHHLTAPQTFDTRFLALSYILIISRLSRFHLPLLWLPYLPSPSLSPLPSSSPSPRLLSSISSPPTPSAPPSPPTRPRLFQSRTFLGGLVIDERRAPTAAWPLPLRRGASSLSVVPSSASLSTLASSGPPGSTSAESSAPPSRISSCRSLHAYGYNGFRVDAGSMPVHQATVASSFAGMQAPDTPASVNAAGESDDEDETKGERFFRPEGQELEIIRLRDNAFEIGRDGRIRRQTNLG